MNPLLSIASEVKHDLAGVRLLKDWLGEGGMPVPIEIAERRSMSCIAGDDGRPCKLNKHPRWWETSKLAVADLVKHQIEAKNGMGIKVDRESELHLCQACGCTLVLKVHVPIKHVKEHTSDEVKKSMPHFCWIKNELNHISP